MDKELAWGPRKGDFGQQNHITGERTKFGDIKEGP